MRSVIAMTALLGVAGCVQDGPTTGRMLYAENCAACHGVDATGNGPAAGHLTTTPPDLTQIAARRNGVWPMLEVMGIIDGYTKSTAPREEMPALSDFREGELVVFDTGNGRTSRAPANLLAIARYLETIQSPRPIRYVP